MSDENHLVGPGLSHLVLNVRDLDASHAFYTEMLGFTLCGTLESGSSIGRMQFYRGDASSHHHIALVQTKVAADPPGDWKMNRTAVGVNHIALNYPTREAFLARIAFLREQGVPFRYRGHHGMTHSLYIQDPDGNGIEVLYDLPAEVWQGDVNAALNYFDAIPVDSPEALEDSTDYVVFTGAAPTTEAVAGE